MCTGSNVSRVSASQSSHDDSQFSISHSLSSSSSAEFNHSEATPVTPNVPKPSQKKQQTQSEVEKDMLKVEKSTLLKFPVTTPSTGRKKGAKKDPKGDRKSPKLKALNNIIMPTMQSSPSPSKYPLKQLLTDSTIVG